MNKKKYFSIQRYRYTENDKKWCAERAEGSWPEEKKHILRVADDAARGEFLFDLPWDMEQTSEKVSYPDGVDWTYMPGDDPEFIYQMNRHRYLVCLGQAYAMTGEERYAETFAGLLADWIRRVPLTDESISVTWRELDAGIRGENWTKAVRYFEDSPLLTESFMELFTGSLREHGEYLMRADRPFLISSNWGVIAYSGLFLIGEALGEERFLETALERLCANARVQVFQDGGHWEQSCMYHNEVLHCFLEVIHSLHRLGRKAPDILTDTAARMALADLAWMKPDGTQPLMGDSDETSIRDVLCFAACVLAEAGRTETAEVLKGCGFACLDYESIWNLGRAGWDLYGKICGRCPERTDWFLEESGNYILRTGWEKNASYLRFRCGCLGGGHGHNDRFHLDLAVKGEDILVDAGRYRYTCQETSCREEGRVWLKSACAHNTILVDGGDYMEYPDAWGTENAVPEMRFPAVQRDGITLLEGAHCGYLRDGIHVLLDRKVLALPGGIWILADTAVSEEEHRISRLFHFNNAGSVLVRDGNRVVYQSGRVNAEILFPDDGVTLAPEKSRLSRHYNSIEENTAVRADLTTGGVRTQGAKPGRGALMFAVISAGEKKDGFSVRKLPVNNPVTGKLLKAEEARALEIRSGERTWTVIFRRQDLAGPADLLEAGGCMGIGRILVSEAGKDPTVFA